MSEESLREVIGLAKKSKWNQIKKYIKFIVQKTLKKEVGYSLTALDVTINGKKKSKFNFLINNKDKINEIDKINSFKHLTLYQPTQISNNLIDISQNNGTIIVLAKYFGPSQNNHQIFDFSVHLDALDEPFFTIGNGKKINCSEVLHIINKKTEPIVKTGTRKIKKELNKVEKPKIQDLEALVFEKLKGKNAVWSGSETKTFQNWKAKLKNKYRKESGNIAYYKGKPTKKYSQHLENLLRNKEDKIRRPSKKLIKKESSSKKDDKEISEQFIFKTLTNKNAFWNGTETKTFQNWKVKLKNKYRKESGNIAYYKGKPTKKYSQHLENLLRNKEDKIRRPSKKLIKKESSSKKDDKEISEQFIFKTLTNKNAFWNGAETKNFIDWKRRIHKKYNKDTGKNPFYRGKLTQNFQKYLKNLIKT